MVPDTVHNDHRLTQDVFRHGRQAFLVIARTIRAGRRVGRSPYERLSMKHGSGRASYVAKEIARHQAHGYARRKEQQWQTAIPDPGRGPPAS